jgi:hypothetical protein
MKKLLSARTAGIVVILLLLGLLILHAFVLAGVISFNLVWGGNIEYRQDMIKLEIFALITTLLFLLITFYKLALLSKKRNSKLINLAVWIMFVYFTLNIITNIAAKTGAERHLFIPVSIVLALFSFRLNLEK